VLACRPATLTAAIVPVTVGTAVAAAEDGFERGPALAALLGALLLQVLANLSNDVFDFRKGADTSERLGPLRVVQAGLLSQRQVALGMALVIALSLAVGVYLTGVGGPWIVVIGVASILSALAYTGGPYPLGYNGLGDVFVMLFFGFVAVGGTAFVQTGEVSALSLAAALPVGALATAVLVVNNLRDADTDIRAGKRTLAVRFGKGFVKSEYAALLALAYAVPTLLAGLLMAPSLLLPWLTLPRAIGLYRSVRQDTGRALNGTLVGTAQLLFFHGVLFATGLATSELTALSAPAGP
jgi:1,4-dihydroxy-2-naphthoate octaprenyltransferase